QTTLAAHDFPIWVGNQDSKTVTAIDPTLGTRLETIHAIAPGGLAVIGNSRIGDTIWASEPTRDLVARIDENSRRIVRQIRIPDKPTRVAADDQAVWVITHASRTLWRIDPKTNTRVAR